MKKSYESKYHNLEMVYWWFEGRRDIIFKLLHLENKNSKILEVGCSGGPLLNYLKQKNFNNLYGMDISLDAVNLCKKRGIKNVLVGDGSKTGFKDNSFDIIIASDILEHIKNDSLALLEWNRILKNKGKLNLKYYNLKILLFREKFRIPCILSVHISLPNLLEFLSFLIFPSLKPLLTLQKLESFHSFLNKSFDKSLIRVASKHS